MYTESNIDIKRINGSMSIWIIKIPKRICVIKYPTNKKAQNLTIWGKIMQSIAKNRLIENDTGKETKIK